MKSRVIGKCIYCGAADNLSREHIVPFGLNGTRVLQQASCSACASITSSFEREVLRESLGAARAVLNINSRRKKGRRASFPMKMERDGEVFVQDVPVDEYVPMIPVLYMGLPGYMLTGRRHQVGDGSRQATLVVKAALRSEDHLDELLRKYNATKLDLDYSVSPVDFGRMLAKIAYCMAVGQFGLSGIVDPYVVPAILGKSNDIWHFVGCDLNYPYLTHIPQKRNALIWVDMDILGGDVMARLRLFPKADAPVYVIVVGRASAGLQGLFQSLGRRLS